MAPEGALRIRPATRMDADALAELRWIDTGETERLSAADWPAFRTAFVHFWLEALASEISCCWVAELAGSMVATAYLEPPRLVPRRGALGRRYRYVPGVYTRPAF